MGGSCVGVQNNPTKVRFISNIVKSNSQRENYYESLSSNCSTALYYA